MLKRLEAQFPTLADAAPEGDGWLHEIKLDGYRMLARIAGGRAQFISRNGKDWTAKFPELAKGATRSAGHGSHPRRRGLLR